MKVEVVGVELRPELVESGNRVAKEVGFDGLRFVPGEIARVGGGMAADVVIALVSSSSSRRRSGGGRGGLIELYHRPN